MTRFDMNAKDRSSASRYLMARSLQVLADGYQLVSPEVEPLMHEGTEWGCRVLFDKPDGTRYQSVYTYAPHRGQGYTRRYYQSQDYPVLTVPDCNIVRFLLKFGVRHKVTGYHIEWPEYRAIMAHYGSTCAKRSGVPLMNHIDEGLAIMRWRGASISAQRAFCLHPLFQSDEDLAATFSNIGLNYSESDVLVLAMEYRNIANATLSHRSIDSANDIPLSPLTDIQEMLVADKVQNRKDFLIHHSSTHTRRVELDRYFRLWLERLGISDDEFNDYFVRLQIDHKYHMWHWPLPDRYPLMPSGQGSFGAKRRYDIHTGVDLYAPEGHPVVAVEDGEVVAIDPAFTGGVESPWWNQTEAVMVEGASGVVLYGEVASSVHVGDHIKADSVLGQVRQVLRERPGKNYPNPLSMLHLELYATGTHAAVWWPLDSSPGPNLHDPTVLLKCVSMPPDIEPAGVAIIVDDFGNVLMLRRHPEDRTTTGLCFPGGKILPNESLPIGIAREVEEETGLKIMFGSYVVAFRTGRFDVHAVRATIVGGKMRSFPTEEHSACVWLQPNEALQDELAGEMTREILLRLC